VEFSRRAHLRRLSTLPPVHNLPGSFVPGRNFPPSAPSADNQNHPTRAKVVNPSRRPGLPRSPALWPCRQALVRTRRKNHLLEQQFENLSSRQGASVSICQTSRKPSPSTGPRLTLKREGKQAPARRDATMDSGNPNGRANQEIPPPDCSWTRSISRSRKAPSRSRWPERR